MKLYIQRYSPLYTHYSMCQFAVIKLDQEYTKEELELKVKQFAIDQLAEEDKITNPLRFEDPKDYLYSPDTLETIFVYYGPLIIEEEAFNQLSLQEVYTELNKVQSRL